MHDDLQLRLASAFPPSADGELIRAFREGILLADGLIDSEPMLMTAVGRDARGMLRRAGITYRIQELCRAGDLPFEATMGPMPRGTWNWLELKSGRFIAHLCRTEGPFSFPAETQTRQDERLKNQNDLFEPSFMPLAEVADITPGLSVWLTFGGGSAGQLSHLCWAMPAADGQEWLAHINVLRRAVATGAVVREDAATPKSLNLRFKEHIEEALRPPQAKSDKRI